MHTIYKIRNNSNIFYYSLSIIFRWYKQFRCSHDWRDKKIGRMEHEYASTSERRCVRCKKVEFRVYNKKL